MNAYVIANIAVPLGAFRLPLLIGSGILEKHSLPT